jgi:hypothetical protein
VQTGYFNNPKYYKNMEYLEDHFSKDVDNHRSLIRGKASIIDSFTASEIDSKQKANKNDMRLTDRKMNLSNKVGKGNVDDN